MMVILIISVSINQPVTIGNQQTTSTSTSNTASSTASGSSTTVVGDSYINNHLGHRSCYLLC